MIRHGQSTANASGVWQGQLEFPLSEEGRRQAAEAGRALKQTTVSSIYASPLSRAFETAQIIAREAGFPGEVIPLPGLMERHGGSLQGKTWADQETNNPEFVKEFLALPEEEQWAFAGAETNEEILGRFEEAFSEILSRHPSGEGSIIVVSHGGVMRAFLRERFGPSILPDHKRAANASITRLLHDPADGNTALQLVELASTRHLPREETRQARAE